MTIPGLGNFLTGLTGSVNNRTTGSTREPADAGKGFSLPQIVADGGGSSHGVPNSTLVNIGQGLISGDANTFRASGQQFEFSTLLKPPTEGPITGFNGKTSVNLRALQADPQAREAVQKDLAESGQIALDAMAAANRGSSKPVDPAQAEYFKQFAGLDGDPTSLTAKEAGAGLLAGSVSGTSRSGLITDGDFSSGDLEHFQKGNTTPHGDVGETYRQVGENIYNAVFGR
jgi:hypothetical protein